MTHKFIAGISHWIYYVAKTTAFSDWGGWYVHERKREEREMTSECSAIIGWGRFVLGFWSPYYIIISICMWMWRCCCCCFCPMVRIWREYGIPLYRTRIIMDGCEMNEQRKLINWIKLSLWAVNDDDVQEDQPRWSVVGSGNASLLRLVLKSSIERPGHDWGKWR